MHAHTKTGRITNWTVKLGEEKRTTEKRTQTN